MGMMAWGAWMPALAQEAVAPPRVAPPAVAPRVGERVRENTEVRRENAERRRESAQEARKDRVANADAKRQIENMDQFMVAWLAPGNEEEIILAKMARERAQSPLVKQFAEQMITDHSACLQKLARFGHVEATFDKSAVDQAAARDAAAAATDNRDTAPPATQPAARPADEGVVRETVREVGEAARELARDVGEAVRSTVGYTDAADACAMKREVHRECLQLTERELDKWQGADFDQAYLGQQAAAHIGMLATLKTFERHATDEMRPLIAEARATTEKHLNHANDLMQKLGHPSTARRSTDKLLNTPE